MSLKVQIRKKKKVEFILSNEQSIRKFNQLDSSQPEKQKAAQNKRI